MNKITNKLVNETYFIHTLKNGLTLIIYPKKNIKTSYASLTVRYGSMNQEFVDTSNNVMETPAGIAHFLEHMIFKKPNNEDITSAFSLLGADVNAYTSYEETCYYFQTVLHFDECLDKLFYLTETPYFTDELVELEKGVILQEYYMYKDDPQDVLRSLVLDCLYTKNKYREDILGTPDSIKSITKELLYQSYETFYHPKNMILSIVGDFEVEEIKNKVENHYKNMKFPIFKDLKTIYYDLDEAACEKKVTKMSVSTPCQIIAAKLDFSSLSEEEILKNSYLFDILLDSCFADSQKRFQDLLRQKVLNYSFSYGYSFEEHYANFYFSLEAINPSAFEAYFTDFIKNINQLDIRLEDFNHFKKVLYANFLKKFSSVSTVIDSIVEYKLNELDYFNSGKVIEDLSYEDLLTFIKKLDVKAIGNGLIEGEK